MVRPRCRAHVVSLATLLLGLNAAGCSEEDSRFTDEEWATLQAMSAIDTPPAQPSNAMADDPDAAPSAGPDGAEPGSDR